MYGCARRGLVRRTTSRMAHVPFRPARYDAAREDTLTHRDRRPRVVAAATLVASAAVATGASSVPAAATPRASGNAAPATEQAIDDAVAAVQAYWRREFRDLYGERYIPVPAARVIAAEPGVKLPTCQGHRLTYQDAEQNAFYCFDDNFVVYDDAELFPQLYEDFGSFAIALVLAHEWGHAIQDRAGNDNEPTINQELQADCFAGAWTDDQSGRSTRPNLEPGDLEASLAAMLSFRDQPGTSADDPSAHGSAFDRVSAFQEGFESGPERCAEYFDEPAAWSWRSRSRATRKRRAAATCRPRT